MCVSGKSGHFRINHIVGTAKMGLGGRICVHYACTMGKYDAARYRGTENCTQLFFPSIPAMVTHVLLGTCSLIFDHF